MQTVVHANQMQSGVVVQLAIVVNFSLQLTAILTVLLLVHTHFLSSLSYLLSLHSIILLFRIYLNLIYFSLFSLFYRWPVEQQQHTPRPF